MKKLVSLFIIITTAMMMFSACKKHDSEKFSIYFKAKSENVLCEETRKMTITTKTNINDKVKFVVAQIIKGPQNEKNKALISNKAKLLSLAINDEVATVDISKEYEEAQGADALLLRLSFINSICSIEGIKGVVIKVDGNPLVSKETGKELGVLSMDDIVLKPGDNSEEKTTVTLYFPDKNEDKLVPETREIEMQKALSLENAVINQLLRGPKNSGCTNALPDGTKLLSIETKDKICFVNFSSEFISKTSSGTVATTLALYSVVNSLCSLDEVKSVQILINGENGVEFGNYVLDIPYEKNNNIVKK